MFSRFVLLCTGSRKPLSSEAPRGLKESASPYLGNTSSAGYRNNLSDLTKEGKIIEKWRVKKGNTF